MQHIPEPQRQLLLTAGPAALVLAPTLAAARRAQDLTRGAVARALGGGGRDERIVTRRAHAPVGERP